jgi:ABC-type dipeptide/oligopeptide/nickel transport system permease component
MPAWLIGMGIISWQGQFDGGAVKSPLNTGNIPFWWDIVVVAGFSLAIYYWAMYSRLPRERMLELVSEQAGTAPEPRLEG